jgi:hypothetical protein
MDAYKPPAPLVHKTKPFIYLLRISFFHRILSCWDGNPNPNPTKAGPINLSIPSTQQPNITRNFVAKQSHFLGRQRWSGKPILRPSGFAAGEAFDTYEILEWITGLYLMVE